MSTTLSLIRIVGPALADEKLWTYLGRVIFVSSQSGPLVDHVATLRGLGARNDTVKIIHRNATIDFHAPPLLKARLNLEVAGHSISAPTAGGHEFGSSPEKSIFDTTDLVLSPNQTWPAPKLSGGNFELTIPDMRLVAGRITTRIKPEGSDSKKNWTDLAKLLHYDPKNHTIFFGHRLNETGHVGEGPLVHLVPEGIEVDVVLPHPLEGVVAGATGGIPVRVRVEPDGRTGFQARLVALLGKNPSNLSAGLQAALRSLEDRGAPLRAETDTRAAVPPFSWLLRLDKTGLHLDHSTPTKVTWRVRIDPSLLVLRLETDTGLGSDRSAVARLDDAGTPRTAELLLERNAEGTHLRYDSSGKIAPTGSTEKISATYESGERGFALTELTSTEGLGVYIPIVEAGARRRQPDTVPRWAFLPVANGTLQIESLPPDLTPSEGVMPTSADRRSTLRGNCVFALQYLTLEVDGAADASLSVTWKNAIVDRIDIGFSRPRGALRGAVWSAEEAPRSDRLLPTGRTDPATLRELSTRFGPGIEANAALTLQGKALGAWKLVFLKSKTGNEPRKALWTTIAGQPLISAAPMLASDAADRPSDLRSLVPVAPADPVRLVADGKSALPQIDSISLTGKPWIFAWPLVETDKGAAWGAPSISFVSPTAPGLDYAWNGSQLPIPESFKVSLRYDLPILDELFAAVDPEAEAEAKTSDPDAPPVPPAPVTGVLDPAEMAKLWAKRSDELAQTRTQGARATAWAAFGAGVSGPLGLAAPHDAGATITFQTGASVDGKKLPLGGFDLTWTGRPVEHFSGETALLGPMGGDCAPFYLELTTTGVLVPAASKETATVSLAGFAPDAYHDTTSGNGDARSLSDTRGTAMAPPRRGKATTTREAGFRKATTGNDMLVKRSLLTLASDLEVNDFGHDVRFWVRDLPLDENGKFLAEKTPIEGSLGPSPQAFEAPSLQDALFEWRFFEMPADGKPGNYAIRHHELTLTPLRLLALGPDEVRILFRAGLDAPDSALDNEEAFGAETPYRTGPLLELTFKRTKSELRLTSATARALADKTSLQLILAGQNPDTLEIPIVAALIFRFAGAQPPHGSGFDDKIAINLSARLGADVTTRFFAGLEATTLILGTVVTLSMKLGPNHAPSGFEYEFTGSAPQEGVWIRKAILEQTGQSGDGWRLSVTLDAIVRLDKDRPCVLDTTAGGLRWLGLTDAIADSKIDVAIDNARGSIWLSRRSTTIAGPVAPMNGITLETVTNWRFSAALVVANVLSEDGAWALDCGIVQGEIAGFTDYTELGLRSQTRWSEIEGRKSKVFLDREAFADRSAPTSLRFQESGIVWDPNGLTMTLPTNKTQAATLKTVRSDETLTHQVSVSLRDAAIPIEAMGEDNGSVGLSQSVLLALQVRHQLMRGEAEIAAWRSFDDVELTSEALWKQKWQAQTFGPRYVKSSAKYRDHASGEAPGMTVAGIGHRSTMLSGFDDAVLLSKLGEDKRFLFIGGGTGLFIGKDKTFAFGLPWVVGWVADPADDLPAAFKGLMGFKAGLPRKWKAPHFDATLFEPAANALPKPIATPISLTGGAALEGFLKAIPDIAKPDGLTRPATQFYVESDPRTTEVADPTEWPLFLPDLVALKAALAIINATEEDQKSSWRVISLRPREGAGIAALALPADGIAKVPVEPASAVQLRLVTLARGEALRDDPLDLPASIHAIEAAVARIGRVRLAELARARVSEATTAGIAVADQAGGFREVRMIAFKTEGEPFGRVRDTLFDPLQQVYPSPALGWPEAVKASDAARFAMDGRSDRPVISLPAGLAARSAVLTSGAATERTGETGKTARMLVTQARAVFHHGAGFEHASLRSPPARHLALLAPRVRSPLPETREAALRKLKAKAEATTKAEGRKGASRPGLELLDAGLGLVPPILSRAFIGERPGIVETHIDALLADGPRSAALDTGESDFGRSAILSPVLARQMRTPRSPALPRDKDFNLRNRRRTYVSTLDRAVGGGGGDKAITMAARPFASVLWRLNESDRFILDLNTIALLPTQVLNAQTNGVPMALELGLRHTGRADPMQALADSGFLNSDQAAFPLRAWLALGETRLDAFRLDWKAPETVASTAGVTENLVPFTLFFGGQELARLLEALRDPDPDTPATLQFSFRATDEGIAFENEAGSIRLGATPETLSSGVPRSLVFPIGRKPLGRPTPDFRRRSFLFADPAFDRVLSSPGASSPIVRTTIDGTSRALMLAVDRTEYDLTKVLYLAFGALEEGALKDFGKEGSLKLRLIPKRGAGGEPLAIDLKIVGVSGSSRDGAPPYAVEGAKVYAIPLGRLRPVDGTGPMPHPGDRLSVEITSEDQALAIDVPLSSRVTDPRPAAVYSVVGIDPGQEDGNGQAIDGTARSRTLLHAAAPAPDRVEFVNLLEDLASGHIRKRAIFEWRLTDLAEAADWPQYTLVKIDRSGGAQLPVLASDFVAAAHH